MPSLGDTIALLPPRPAPLAMLSPFRALKARREGDGGIRKHLAQHRRADGGKALRRLRPWAAMSSPFEEFMSLQWLPDDGGTSARSRSRSRSGTPPPRRDDDGILIIPLNDEAGGRPPAALARTPAQPGTAGKPPMPTPPFAAVPAHELPPRPLAAAPAQPGTASKPPMPLGPEHELPPAPLAASLAHPGTTSKAPFAAAPAQLGPASKAPMPPPPLPAAPTVPDFEPRSASPDRGNGVATSDPYGGEAGATDTRAALLALTASMSQEELDQWWNLPAAIAAESAAAVQYSVPWRERGPPGPGEGGPRHWKGASWRPNARRWATRGGAGSRVDVHRGGADDVGEQGLGDLSTHAAFWARWYGEGVASM